MTAQMHKMWLVTHNNPKMTLEEYMEMWKPYVVYGNGQLEKGEEGTRHIQAYLSLERSQRLSWLKKKDRQAHFEPVKKDNGASRYCLKEETRLEGPIHVGERPIAKNIKTDWKLVRECAQEGRFAEIPDDIYIRCYNQICRIFKDHQTLPKREYVKKCFWLWGKPRTGKTRMATSEPHYRKLVNKWWDAYQGEKRVVIDDVGLEKGKTLLDHFKTWGDPWNNCPGENKGGQLPLVFDELYITSNYPLDQIASGVDLEALRARFVVIHFDKLM